MGKKDKREKNRDGKQEQRKRGAPGAATLGVFVLVNDSQPPKVTTFASFLFFRSSFYYYYQISRLQALLIREMSKNNFAYMCLRINR
jgi:hypothetical protein